MNIYETRTTQQAKATQPSQASFATKATHLIQKVGIYIWLTCALAGCARFHTLQTDNRYENGKLVGSITTKASSFTLFSSKSQLANFQASQTEKTQGAKVGLLSQQGATNTGGTIHEMTDLVKELNRLKSPIPTF